MKKLLAVCLLLSACGSGDNNTANTGVNPSVNINIPLVLSATVPAASSSASLKKK